MGGALKYDPNRGLSLDEAWDECAACGAARHSHPNIVTACNVFVAKAKAEPPMPTTLAQAVGIKPDPLKVQVGGDHYTKLKIQPMQYSMANGLDALQHTVVKYVTRFRDKNGIEDLKKARHAIDMLIAHEEHNGTAIR
jgi:hypothetical protein